MKEKVKNSALSIFHIVGTPCEFSSDIMNQGYEKAGMRGPFIVSFLFNNHRSFQLDVISMLFVEVLYCFGFSFPFTVCI